MTAAADDGVKDSIPFGTDGEAVRRNFYVTAV